MTTIDRSIRLDVSVPDFGSRLNPQDRPDSGSLLKNSADPQAQQRFDEAMAAKPTTAPLAASHTAPILAPSSLFGAWNAFGATPPAVPTPSPFDAELGQDLLERLMVDDGAGHSGGKQVRMELKSDVLPGVSIAIEEAEGRLQVRFICSVESSRLRLVAAAPLHAQTLAERLQRPVLLQVQTDDADDLYLFEVASHA